MGILEDVLKKPDVRYAVLVEPYEAARVVAVENLQESGYALGSILGMRGYRTEHMANFKKIEYNLRNRFDLTPNDREVLLELLGTTITMFE